MATAGDQSIFKTFSCDGSKEIQEIIVNLRDDLVKEDKNGLKYLTAVCFQEHELESLDGFRDCLCDILHKYKLPLSFVAKALQEIGRKDLVKKYLLHPDVKSRSPEECLQLFEDHLSDERTLLNDDKLDPIIMLFRFTLYRIAQSFGSEEKQGFKEFISQRYRQDFHTKLSANSVEEIFQVLEGVELLTPGNTEIVESYLANGPDRDKDFQQEVRKHLESYKAKFNELSTVPDGVGDLSIRDECHSPTIGWYNMSSKIRGYCVILVQTGDRTGADKECDKLKLTFESLRFRVEVHENYTHEGIIAAMCTYGKMDHSEFDSFVCFILGHGQQQNNKDYLMCSDKVVVNVDTLLSSMNAESLRDKPKLFFINICRYDPGDGQTLPGLESPELTDAVASIQPSLHSHNSFSSIFDGDVLKAYSTASGTKSNRSKREGAWYITALCEVIEEHKHRKPLMHMLMLVHQRVCKKRNPGLKADISQAPQCCNQLKKMVYFRDNFP